MEIVQTNVIEFSGGPKAVPLWMLDYLNMFWELSGDFTLITYDEFIDTINKRFEKEIINDLLIEKFGYNPLKG